MQETCVVIGGAGFIGSHLVDRLAGEQGYRVVVVDNESTGSFQNLERWRGHPSVRWERADISQPLPEHRFGLTRAAIIFHLASPASPVHYRRLSIETLLVNSVGTLHALEWAQELGSRFILASTSEVYGDPEITPQPEEYWGHVNPVGFRACYDESKRFAEALTMEWHRRHRLDVRILRFFNCYGPRMQMDDGRVVPNFVAQALRGEPLTVYGDGSQTRSFCYVSDQVEAIVRAATRPNLSGQILNIGNPEEHTILDFAQIVSRVAGVPLRTERGALPPDDPTNRRPDIRRAQELLDWRPTVSLEHGLSRTIADFRARGVAS
ncbi:MAG: NAD-dependent epimerase/dehydratase family protein [Clostridia bacterium]